MRGRAPLVIVLAVMAALAGPGSAGASWNAGGGGDSYAVARSLGAGSAPTTSVSGRNVTVNWSATGGNVPVAGYVVRRYSSGGIEQTVGAACSGTIAGTSCTESSVPSGNWRYTVTPARQNWRGAESPQSPPATVGTPSLSLTPASVNTLPATLTGQIQNFLAGQTVTFRLDNQSSGQVLTGSITPSPVPANGTANVSVTLPAGVANGSHTIFAIGSGSDVASANVTVAVPTTIQTAAFDWRDASSGTESNQTELVSFDDNRTTPSGNFTTTFSTARYVEYRLNAPLRPGYAPSSVSFDVRFASSSASSQACFYFDVRRASDNSVLGTHGSAASPVGCAGTTETAFSVPLPEVDTSAKANDLNVRVYGRGATANAGFVTDLATVSGSGPDGAFTLYPNVRVAAPSGGAGTTTTWPLFADDNVLYASDTAWSTTFAATRYLRATFPSYVPAGAALNSATLTHTYRTTTNNREVCNYVEIYSGSTLIGTHGSSATPLSCNSSTATERTDTIALPEVDTVAEANSLQARILMRRTGTPTTTSQHDLLRLSVTYTK